MKKTRLVVSGVVLGVAALAGGVLWYQNTSVQDSLADTLSQNQELDQMGNESDDVVFVNTEDSDQDLDSIEQAFSEESTSSVSAQASADSMLDAEIQSLESDLNESMDQDMGSNTSDLEQLL